MPVDVKSLNKDGTNLVITDINKNVKMSVSPYSTQVGLESDPRDLVVTNNAYYSDVKETERIVPLARGLVNTNSTFDSPSGTFIQPSSKNTVTEAIAWLDSSVLPDRSLLTSFTLVYTRKTNSDVIEVAFGRSKTGSTDALSSLFTIDAPSATAGAISLVTSDTFSHEIDYSTYGYFLKTVAKGVADQANSRIINVHLNYKGGDF